MSMVFKRVFVLLSLAGFILAAAGDLYEYKIGPKDLLIIRVFQVPELNTTVRVGEDGTITLPLLGKISVGGLTRYQLERKIAGLLSRKFVKNPQVTVFIKEYRSRTALIMGAVRKPGSYEIVGKTTLLQLIAMAGGITSAARDRIIVIRNQDGRQRSLIIPIADLLLEGKVKENIEILPGDVVNIPGQINIEVYVFGQVRNPGVVSLPLGSGTTVLQAIAKAGGFTERAKKSSVLIRRREEGREKIIVVNIKAILRGKAQNIKLKPYDVIYVPESLF